MEPQTMSNYQEPGKRVASGQELPTLKTIQADPSSPSYPPKTRSARVKKRDTSQWERSDDYRGALFRIPRTPWRVAVCKEGHQWILQRREAEDHWEGHKYFSNKKRLGQVVEETLGAKAFGRVRSKIDALPI
jgi:hypothetical protein